MEQATKKLKSIRNMIAAKSGLYLGIAFYSSLLLNYLCSSSFPSIAIITSFLDCIYLALFLFTAAAAYRRSRGAAGVVFVDIFGFLMFCMACTGFIYGTLYFVQTVLIDPAYYSELSIRLIRDNDVMTNEQKDLAMEAFNSGGINNPFIVVFSSIFRYLLLGVFPSLIVAAITKRSANKQR